MTFMWEEAGSAARSLASVLPSVTHGRLAKRAGPFRIWQPGEHPMEARASRYHEVYAQWQRDPVAFWAQAARDLDWIEPAPPVFDPQAGVYGRWFAGALCNTCWNAVDRHVHSGRGSQAAIIYDSPLAGEKRTITYDRLLTEVQVLAAILRDLGVGRGDRVIIYMPMVPEAVFAMLA